jgi:hypothetical protein
MRDLREAGMVLPDLRNRADIVWSKWRSDPYYTDGEIDVATLVIDGVRQTEPPVTLPPPPLIALKDQVWHSVSNAIGP